MVVCMREYNKKPFFEEYGNRFVKYCKVCGFFISLPTLENAKRRAPYCTRCMMETKERNPLYLIYMNKEEFKSFIYFLRREMLKSNKIKFKEEKKENDIIHFCKHSFS